MPLWCQAITWTNADFLSITPLGTNLKEILVKVLPFYPSALRAGGVLSSRSGRAGGRTGGRAGRRSGGRLPDLRNPYLCNRLKDFLRSKFYGIV